MAYLDLETVSRLVPKKVRSMIDQSLVDELNAWSDNPVVMDSFKENMVTYSGVLQDGRFKVTDYINAVKFVSLKLLEFNDFEAYEAVFPDRVNILRNRGIDDDGIRPYASAYKKNKLVVSIFQQTIIPTYVLNAPLHQDALNKLSVLMNSSRSDLVKVKAAEAILNYTKMPETKKIELDLGVNTIDAMAELKKASEILANQQQASIQAGVPLKEIAESRIIEAEIEEITNG